jgi:hypothetical protein
MPRLTSWNALPGKKSENVYECEHSTLVKFTFNKGVKRKA